MGGARETTIPQKSGQVVVGNVRLHEQCGEVHFHDDANGLKVAVPVATWMAAFQSMEANLPAVRQFVDPQQKTVLYVQMAVKPKKPKEGVVPKAVVTLRIKGGVEVDAEYASLRKFTYGV